MVRARRLEVDQGLDVAPRHDEHMAWEHRTVIEERHRHLVVEHQLGRLGAGDDRQNEVVGHGGNVFAS
jgi:hypothetical protein